MGLGWLFVSCFVSIPSDFYDQTHVDKMALIEYSVFSLYKGNTHVYLACVGQCGYLFLYTISLDLEIVFPFTITLSRLGNKVIAASQNKLKNTPSSDS